MKFLENLLSLTTGHYLHLCDTTLNHVTLLLGSDEVAEQSWWVVEVIYKAKKIYYIII